jgi:Na+-transporting NADH:ubiquinone oxidoreductase subunit C
MSVRERAWYPVAYMFILTAAFSTVLIGFARWTRPQVEANEQIAFEKAVLRALPIDIPEGASNADLHQLFVERVKPPDASSAGAHRMVRGDQPIAYVILFGGRGFWNPIKGVIGVASDRRTITGIAFYEQNETPGLGAEITTPRFRDQFRKGKLISGAGRPLTFVPESADAGESEVNAITGATQTCTRLERIINGRLAEWRKTMAKPSGAEE